MPRLTFLQPYDPKGYRIVVKQPKKPGKTLAEGAGLEPSEPTTWIVCHNVGKLDYARVMFEKEPIYKKLARTKPTPEGALAFVQKYGFLLSTSSRERVEDICNHIQTMQWLLKALKDDDRLSINLWLKGFDPGDLKSLYREPVRRGLKIGTDESDRKQLWDSPPTLIEALYLQCLQDETGNKHSKLCLRPGCGNDFYYGPNTGRRSTAKYCSEGCRVKHFMERKENSK